MPGQGYFLQLAVPRDGAGGPQRRSIVLYYMDSTSTVLLYGALLCVVLAYAFRVAGQRVAKILTLSFVGADAAAMATGRPVVLRTLAINTAMTQKFLIKLMLGLSVLIVAVALTMPSSFPMHSAQNRLPPALSG